MSTELSTDVAVALQPIGADAPCGPDLSYDPAYAELDRLSQGVPEREMGQQKIAAEPPDWKGLRQRCEELLTRTKDLRVAVYLTLARLQTEGLPGLASGLAVVRGLLERYWDCVHPQL